MSRKPLKIALSEEAMQYVQSKSLELGISRSAVIEHIINRMMNMEQGTEAGFEDALQLVFGEIK